MRLIEKTLFLLFIVSFSVTIFANVPLLILMLATCLPSLALLYATLGWAVLNDIGFRAMFKKETYAGITQKHLLMGGITGLAFTACMLGSWFVVQRWPGGRELLFCGMTVVIASTVVSAINKNKPAPLYKQVLIRAVPLLVTMLLLLPMLW